MPHPEPHPTRRLLIDTALRLFAAEGVRATTVRKIEEASGLTPGAGGMYRHFRSKEELLEAAVNAYYDEVVAFATVVPDVVALDDLAAELRTAAKLFREFHARHDAIVRIALMEGLQLPAKVRRKLEASWEQGYAMYADWLRRRLGPRTKLDIEATAIQLFGSLANFHAQRQTFSKAPLGVSDTRFTDSWASHWAAFLEAAQTR